jgi:hypothetical protein
VATENAWSCARVFAYMTCMVASRWLRLGALLFCFVIAAGCERPTASPGPSSSASTAPVTPVTSDAAAPVAAPHEDAGASPAARLEGNTLGMPTKSDLLPLAAAGERCRGCFFNGRCALLVLSDEKLPCCDYASGTVPKRPMSKDAHVDDCLAAIGGGGGYPTGKTCADAKALVNEHRSLPPRESWLEAQSPAQRITTRVPPGVFSASDGPPGFVLTSSVKANGLGPDAKPIPFAIRIRRVARSIDDLVADKTKTSLLAGSHVEGAFPKRTEQSFTASMDDDAGVGSASKLMLRGLTAYAFVSGGHGYNNDTALVRVGAKDTVVVRADWNSSIMGGQPECWQRQIIAGVLDQLNVH